MPLTTPFVFRSVFHNTLKSAKNQVLFCELPGFTEIQPKKYLVFPFSGNYTSVNDTSPTYANIPTRMSRDVMLYRITSELLP